MVRSTENRNSLLQLTKRVQIANNDREAIDTGDDSAAPEDHHHAPEESVITQVHHHLLGCSWRTLKFTTALHWILATCMAFFFHVQPLVDRMVICLTESGRLILQELLAG